MDLEDIKWWVEDNLKNILGLALLIVVVVMSFLVFQAERDSNREIPRGYEGQIQLLKENEEQIKEQFSLLGEFDTETHEDEVIHNVELFNKKPFSSRKNIEDSLNKYIDGLNIIMETRGKTLRGAKITIYDRKLKHELGVEPDGEFYYGIPYEKIPDSEKDDEKSRYLDMSPNEAAFEYTSLVAPRKIKTDDHELYGKYKVLTRDPRIKPLTDQEYAWYVKLEHYLALGSRRGSLYLEWELGAPKKSKAEALFKQDIDRFHYRITGLGGRPSIYGNKGLKVRDTERRLVIENPSFLWYVESGKVVEDAIEARSNLVKKYPQKYRATVEEWVESLAKEQIDRMEQGIDPEQERRDKESKELEEYERELEEEYQRSKGETTDSLEGESEEEPEEEPEGETEGDSDRGKKPVF